MRFCRFHISTSSGGREFPRFGLLDGDEVHEITAAPWATWSKSGRAWRLNEVQLLAPVLPSKIVCVGRNYAAHAAELGNEVPKEPLIFLKPPSAIIGPGEAIVLTSYSHQVEHEGELALVVGRRCSHLDDDSDPLAYLLGYTCLNDVTARDIQKVETLFDRAKGFDTFCPIGPYIETELNPRDALVETRVNSTVRQSGRTSLMIYPVVFLVRWISRMMTLEPGDIIATGTPAGVGPLQPGDNVEVSVSGVGRLQNPVRSA